nr:hypothetical protein [Tanacetum cinerariifolium]
LSIIESKSKVRYSRSRVTDVRANANDPLSSSSSHSNSFDLQQIAAALEDKLDIRMNRFEKSLNEMKNSFVTPTAPLKAVTEESEPRQEEIDVVSKTNDLLPQSDDDSDDEVDVVGSLRVDNVIQDSEHEYSESEDFDLDNPLLPLPPPEPPDTEFDFEIDFEKEISVMRNLIVKFECIDARMKFDDIFKFIMFSFLSVESEDTIFDPGMIIPRWLKTSCVGYCPGFQDLRIL